MHTQESSIYSTEMPSGAHWSFHMKTGSGLRLTDLTGQLNVGMLFYNPHDLLERYNAPDTLKCQHTFYLQQGHCLYSDMGRIFCAIEQDNFGGHETICGTSQAEQIAAQFGALSYQEAHNQRHQNGYQSFLTELAKYGLNKRDMAANINWFAHLGVHDNGDFFLSEEGKPHAQVTLRFAMDTLVILHTCPHPLSQLSAYPKARLQLDFLPVDKPVPEQCLLIEENQRGLQNNALYQLKTVTQFNQLGELA